MIPGFDARSNVRLKPFFELYSTFVKGLCKNHIVPATMDRLRWIDDSPFWSPLPGREPELLALNDFIRGSFTSATPRALVVTGPPQSGKTSCLQLCASMSVYARQIRFVEDSSSFPFLNGAEFVVDRHLVIFDNFTAEIPVGPVVAAFSEANWSTIFVTVHVLDICEIPMQFCSGIVSFGRYSFGQIVEILKEKTIGVGEIPEGLFPRIAEEVMKRRGGVLEAMDVFLQEMRQTW
jgi:hypothetical protein